jgi:cell division protein FtsB
MNRSAVARADHRRVPGVPRAQTAAAQRRVSGPMRPAGARVDGGALAMSDAALAPHPVPRPRVPARPPLRVVAGGAAIALRVAEAALEVSGSRTMDRLVRSRAWIVIVAFGLIGIVAMQVSMLKLNAGIGRAVETAATLERSNATLRADVSQLSSGERIQSLAGARSFIMPEPGDVTYLTAGNPASDGFRAAQRMSAPDPAGAGPAGSAMAGIGTPAITGPVAPDAAAAPVAGAATTDPAATAAAAASGATAVGAAPASAPAGGSAAGTGAAATAPATSATATTAPSTTTPATGAPPAARAAPAAVSGAAALP